MRLYKDGDLIITQWNEWRVMYKVVGLARNPPFFNGMYECEILHNYNAPVEDECVVGYVGEWHIEAIDERSVKVNSDLAKAIYE